MAAPNPVPIKVFISYSHTDEDLRKQLDVHLKVLQREGIIQTWHDREIMPGEEWAKEIDKNLNQSQIVLLLVSAAFLNSEYCYNNEMKRALARHEAGETCVIPVILRPALWKVTLIGRLQAIPKDGKAITTWPNQDEAFLDVAEGIQKAAIEMAEQLARQGKPPGNSEDKSPPPAPVQTVAPSKAEEEYRKTVREVMRDGQISPTGRRVLNLKQTALRLGSEEAQRLEEAELESFRQHQEDLKEYEHALLEALEHDGGQLGDRSRSDLRHLQTMLNLSDEEVADAERRVKKKFFSTSIDVPTQTFSFEVVIVDPKGKEVNRQLHESEGFREVLGKGIFLEMMAIPGRTFLMGAPEDELDSRDNERPQHRVKVPPFWMGRFPVTQAQWQAVAAFPKINRDLDPNPSKFNGANRPVEQVNWFEAVEFCDRLSTHTQRQYRLPSEAEWEYACRAGTTTPFHLGETITPDFANYDGNYAYGEGPQGKYRRPKYGTKSLKR